jgi:hypothetical protein
MPLQQSLYVWRDPQRILITRSELFDLPMVVEVTEPFA